MLAFNARSVIDNSGQNKTKAKATETPVGTHIGQAHPNAPGVQNTSRDPSDPIQTAAYPGKSRVLARSVLPANAGMTLTPPNPLENRAHWEEERGLRLKPAGFGWWTESYGVICDLPLRPGC